MSKKTCFCAKCISLRKGFGERLDLADHYKHNLGTGHIPGTNTFVKIAAVVSCIESNLFNQCEPGQRENCDIIDSQDVINAALLDLGI